MFEILSGEFFLKGRANGGTVIFLRSVFITLLVYAVAIGLKSRLALDSTWGFDWGVARQLIAETIPWFGAIFAGVYVALYSRFASQWNYLASLYNQIMGALVQHPPKGMTHAEVMALWEAGFIEDAEELHLARKPMFASIISSLLQDKSTREAYADFTPGGAVRLSKLEKAIEIVLERTRTKYGENSLEIPSTPATSAPPSP